MCELVAYAMPFRSLEGFGLEMEDDEGRTIEICFMIVGCVGVLGRGRLRMVGRCRIGCVRFGFGCLELMSFLLLVGGY